MTVAATPAAIAAAIKACAAACVITLTPGTYAELQLSELSPLPQQVTLDLTGSTFGFVDIEHVSNLTIVGGTVSKGNQWGYCWDVDFSSNIVLKGGTANQCAAAGWTLNRSTNLSVIDWTLTANGCDGVDVAGVSGFTVTGGKESGYVSGSACHADLVQIWSMAGYETQNGVISNNSVVSTDGVDADGKSRGTQGIDAWNDNGPNGGSFPIDNITVTGNILSLHGESCVSMISVTHLTATGNSCTNNQPEPWASKYEWTGSSGTIGPNLLDGKSIVGVASSPGPTAANVAP